jgi:hypothetical protein
MKSSSPGKHFYLFGGNWHERFNDLSALARKTEGQVFELWEPVDKTKKFHMLVVSGQPLTDTYCLVRKIWKTDEQVFSGFFREELETFQLRKIGN